MLSSQPPSTNPNPGGNQADNVPSDSKGSLAGRPPGDGGGPKLVAITGNPNCGKTTLFNGLTGLRSRVANYPGVTVERKEGLLLGSRPEAPVRVLDLPGTYSLSPHSPDEQISRDVLCGRQPGLPAPDLVIVVVDAANLQRNLYYATQVIELGLPTAVALNMMDVAEAHGHRVNPEKLAKELGVPVFPVVAAHGEGVEALRETLRRWGQEGLPAPGPQGFCRLPDPFAREVEMLTDLFGRTTDRTAVSPRALAALILTEERSRATSAPSPSPALEQAVHAARTRLESAGLDWRTVAIQARYARVGAIQRDVVTETPVARKSLGDRLDPIVTHRFWGPLLFVAVMALMFQSIFTLARPPMDALQAALGWLGLLLTQVMPAGDLRSLLVNGVIAGVGAVVVFLPQIALLFLFIALLEDTGYMARAAFVMDRLMSRVGLHGKSFIPLLSCFACAVPGIMATRTIESPRDRLVTILVGPLMSCSARLPVFTLLIGACIPDHEVLGLFRLPGLVLLAMYLLGILAALIMAWIFKKTLLRGEAPLLIMELPPYQRPRLGAMFHHMWDRSRAFLHQAATVILAVNILLWFLVSYPHDPHVEARFRALREQAAAAKTKPGETAVASRLAELDRQEAAERAQGSFAGRLGRAFEPLIRPLGFDWKIGIGIIGSFAAREVFISTVSVVYSLGHPEDPKAATQSLVSTLRQQLRPDGTPVYTTMTGLSLMVFYVLALQCVSTLAVVRRETNSWKWPLFQWLYMGALAWTCALLTFQGGRLLGFR